MNKPLSVTIYNSSFDTKPPTQVKQKAAGFTDVQQAKYVHWYAVALKGRGNFEWYRFKLGKTFVPNGIFIPHKIKTWSLTLSAPQLVWYNFVCKVRDLNFFINKELYKKTGYF